MKSTFIILISLLFAVQLLANPPRPDSGKRWVVNPDYSDEFNGVALDDTKWFDYHPTWKGREPGIFVPEMVKVQNGYLKLWSEKMDEDTVITSQWSGKEYTYNIKCAAVITKSQTAHYGYYECRFKAAATTMSTTFWFSNRNNFDGPQGCGDKFSQEWDVQECIGREGNFSASWFAKGMHSNAHYWYTDCDDESFDYRAEEVRYENDNLASEQFDTYGGWWHDAIRATYYYNNADPKEQTFYTGETATPMAKPMGMNLVHETYPFPWISLPMDRELADTSMNYCLYDWVRAYLQVDADAGSPYANTPQLHLYDENITFDDDKRTMASASSLALPFTFQCNSDRKIRVKLCNDQKAVLVDTTIVAYQGYANYLLDIELEETLATGAYSIEAELTNNAGDESVGTASMALTIGAASALNFIEEKSLLVAPNPASDKITLVGYGAESNYAIYDLQGQKVKSGILNSDEISVRNLASGYYVLALDKWRAKFFKI